eukprot:5545045-Amphidinium_carterae.1
MNPRKFPTPANANASEWWKKTLLVHMLRVCIAMMTGLLTPFYMIQPGLPPPPNKNAMNEQLKTPKLLGFAQTLAKQTSTNQKAEQNKKVRI